MGDFATNSAFMWTNITTKPYAGFDKGRSWNFRNGDIAALTHNVRTRTISTTVQASRRNTSNSSFGTKVVRSLFTEIIPVLII